MATKAQIDKQKAKVKELEKAYLALDKAADKACAASHKAAIKWSDACKKLDDLELAS